MPKITDDFIGGRTHNYMYPRLNVITYGKLNVLDKYKYTTSISYYIIIYLLYVCLNIHNSKIDKNLSLFFSNSNANIDIIKTKMLFTLETFSTFSGTKLGLSMYFLSFFSIVSGMLSLSYVWRFFRKLASPRSTLADCQSVLLEQRRITL